jgi:hypothetical protein
VRCGRAVAVHGTHAGGRADVAPASERAPAIASVGPALASSDISELQLQLFIVTARTQKKGALACRRTRRLA